MSKITGYAFLTILYVGTAILGVLGTIGGIVRIKETLK